jgi:hypothetical protein
MPHQPHLPGVIDPRPTCPGCKNKVHVLGQWSPGNKAILCRACTEAHPAPDIFEVKPSTDNIRLKADATVEERWMNLHMENMFSRLKRGCHLTLADADPQAGLPCEAFDYPAQWECRLCRAELKRHTRRLESGVDVGIAVLHFRSHLSPVMTTPYRGGRRQDWQMSEWDQQQFPICSKCGAVHSRKLKFFGGYASECQACADEASARSFYDMRAIFGDADVEDIMDRIHRAAPELFERGVFPDRWFELALEEKEKN